MTAGIILQARMTGKRFPNKMLCSLNGKPVIQRTIEACLKSKLPLVVAIPRTMSNQALAEWMRLAFPDIEIYGSYEEDVAARFQDANELPKFDPIIRVCGDSPLMDPGDIQTALVLYNERKRYTRVNLVEVFSAKELNYVCGHDPFIERRQHCVQMLNQTVDYPEDISRLEEEMTDG